MSTWLTNSPLHTPILQRRPPLLLVAVLLLTTLFFGMVMAQPSPLPEDTTLTRTLAKLGGQPITLTEARNLALKNSTQVRVAQAQLNAARGTARRERGAFDPILFAQASHSKTISPTSSPFAGTEEKTTMWSAGANMRLRFGTQLKYSINSTRLESNSAFSSLNPQYSAMGQFEITQPLLSGSWPAAKAPVTGAERALDAAESRYRDAVLAIVQLVDNTYWDLYAAERDLAVLQLTLARSEAFLRETKIRGDAGLVGPGDVASATVFNSQQQQDELDGEETLERVSNDLSNLVGQRVMGGESHYLSADTPPWPEVPTSNVDSLVKVAVDNNYVVKASELDRQAALAISRGARWNVLPAVDLFGTFGGNGLAGTGQQIIFGTDTIPPSTLTGGGSDALNQAISRDYPTWTIGVRFSLPLGMRSTRGERDRLEAQTLMAEQTHVAAVRAVDAQVRNTMLEFGNAQKRLAAAIDGVKAAQDQVRIGNLQFKAGNVSAFELVRLNADLASAQLRYSRSLVKAAKAATSLKRLTGDNFESTIFPANK